MRRCGDHLLFSWKAGNRGFFQQEKKTKQEPTREKTRNRQQDSLRWRQIASATFSFQLEIAHSFVNTCPSNQKENNGDWSESIKRRFSIHHHGVDDPLSIRIDFSFPCHGCRPSETSRFFLALNHQEHYMMHHEPFHFVIAFSGVAFFLLGAGFHFLFGLAFCVRCNFFLLLSFFLN